MKIVKKYISITTITISAVLFSSCEKQLEVDQDSLYLVDEAVSTPQQLQAFLLSAYDVAGDVNDGTYQIFADLPGDDLVKPYNDGGTFRTEAYDRATTIFNSDIISLYTDFYRIVYRVNTIESLFPQVAGLTDE
jgi:hypothetical protein